MAAIPHPFGGVPKVNGDVITHTELNNIADNLVKAPNFVDGGATYTLADPIDINGALVTIEQGSYGLPSTQFTRVVRDVGVPDIVTNWTFGNASGDWSTTGNGAYYLHFQLDLPSGCTLDEVTAYVDPQNMGGALPGAGAGPALYVGSVAVATGVLSDITGALPGVADPQENTTIGAYEAVHAITANALATAVDNEANRYFAVVRGATAGGARTVRVIGLLVKYTLTQLDHGAA
jgi:hypothetical protein